MRNRLTIFAWLVVLGVVGSLTLSLTHGQDTTPRPPVVRPGTKVRVALTPAPAPPAQRDLSKLTPLQKQMYLAARRATHWLDHMNELNGRFVDGLQPTLNVRQPGDHPLRQAGAAFVLARAARFLANDNQIAHVRQAILAQLENTVAVGDKKVRHGVLPSPIVNRLSGAALLVLAIHELPNPDADLLAKSDQLCEYIRRQQRADGSLRVERRSLERAEDDAEEAQVYPGQALYALMRSQQHRPAEWKTTVVTRALPFYLKWWRDHKGREFVAWHTAACAEALQATKDRQFADAVFEMNDWLCGLQHEGLDPQHPQWLGGFPSVIDGKVVSPVPDVTSAVCTEALAEACRVTRQQGDLKRHERYSAALERGLQFLTTLQYADADTQHYADWYRPQLVGGFHFSHQDGNLRIDHTQHALAALVQYLRHVAQME